MSIEKTGSNISHVSKSLRRAGWWVWWYGRKVEKLKKQISKSGRLTDRRIYEHYKQAAQKLKEAAEHYTFLMKQVNHELVKLADEAGKK